MEEPKNIIEEILNKKTIFVIVFFFVFTLSYGALFALDMYPEPPSSSEDEEIEEGTDDKRPSELHLEATVGTGNGFEPTLDTDKPIIKESPGITYEQSELPVLISFPSLGRSIPVLNPQSRNIEDLDSALLSGAVRHPDSATFTNEGTIFVLGHSSYLPNVLNKNFQAFNGIQNLKWGETIELQSEDTTYVYRIEKVYQAKASELTVPIAGTGPKLVIATCNSFASKDDRYVVEAKLIDQIPL